jgi:type IX secretion system PorP/SprF family membrane protein
MNDQTGPTGFTGIYARIGAVISGDPTYSGLAIAISGGMVQYRVNSSEINLRDPGDVLGMNDQTEMFPDVGAGIYFYQMLSGGNMDGDMFYAGVSIPQVAGIDLTFKNEDGDFAVQRVRHYYAMTGLYHFFRNDGFLEPSLWVKYVDGAPVNADLNLRYQTPNALWIGTGASSSGNFHFEAGFNLGDNVGFDNNLKIGYGYDYSFATFGPSVGNTHELQVSYSFD